MRKIILFSLNLLIMHAVFAQLKCRVGELNINPTSNVHKSDTAPRITLRCYRVLPDNTAPLLIINNKFTPLSQLSAVNPNDIVSVEIIKPPKATAIYGVDGVGGVILVTLKSAILRMVDATDRHPIPFATIKLNAKNENLMTVADSNGYLKLPHKFLNTSFSLEALLSRIFTITNCF